MLRRELLPDLFLDPSFNPLTRCAPGSHSQKSFSHPLLPFLQFAHGIDQSINPWVYEHQARPGIPVAAADVSWYGSARGGIICEDMGTGKTCECLALILITKRQMAQPPLQGESLPCVGVVCSPLATDICSSIVQSQNSKESAVGPNSVLPLKALAANAAVASCVESLRIMHEDGVISDNIWELLEPCPPYYWVDPIADRRSKRGIVSRDAVAFKVFMSSSTIIVVPDNLVDQWVREKYKHIEDTNGLEMLKIDSSMETIPEPTTLIKYDIVLIAVSRLASEYIPIEAEIDELRHLCRCLNKCQCRQSTANAGYRSPLLRVHWKRLIVDEGHIMSSRNTARALMAAYLIADRRWICTGTPTHNLIHATSTLATDAESRSDGEPALDQPRARGRYRMDARENSSDFFQLGILVSKFLRMDPFAHSKFSWTSIMVQPYKRRDPNASKRLQALLQSIMVRNRPETISSEVQLPPLHEETVLLPPTRLQALTYNAVVAFFHINAILTEREGRDYFFHPGNKSHLRQIVANLFMACFWFSISLKHIQDGIENGKRALDLWAQGQKPYSSKDAALLRQSISVLEQAAGDTEWICAVQAGSIGYHVANIPPQLETKLLKLQNPSCSYLATVSQLQALVSAAKAMLNTADDGLPPLNSNLPPSDFDKLQAAAVLSTTANKIAYLIGRLQRYAQDEKCIVFVNSQNDVAHIDDALCLARIPHLLYANSVMTQSQRLHNITTFASSIMYNVIVMDVRLAAYGIDLSAASRVWFLSPIWQAARERQAIKRAHRLGQQRPVFVETLLTQGSIEEALWVRRQEISNSDNHIFTKDIEEDGKMRTMLSNARFIEHGDSGILQSEFRIMPPNIRYPALLRQKYQQWSADPVDTNKLPFPKLKRLVLRVSDPCFN
ncbi:hypothetical protein LPJ79_001353 [Coemansia sp. RSA 1821]|nr:hypothetical protein LPJ68_001389 [Coemansia sp. RSA 1086]KAJ1752275.1 hypothetical protein LPJ79_001353 [Coemansia sp. RSA 1821]KAJ2671051.1 hypothetical protein IWW42_003603 [Coemansia sp. RSA 1085]